MDTPATAVHKTQLWRRRRFGFASVGSLKRVNESDVEWNNEFLKELKVNWVKSLYAERFYYL